MQLLEDDVMLGDPERRHERAWLLLTDRLRKLVGILLRQSGRLKSIDAADLMQDVPFELQSPSGIRKLRAARSPKRYLVDLVRNQIVDQIWRERSELGGRTDLELTVREGDRPSISFEDTLAIEMLLDRLSDTERRLLHLRFWEGRSIQSIADELGIKYSAAAVRLFRLLGRLREQLKPSPM